ncbi:hypothetical protein [Streptomyces sp. URMC 129]|uniref:hypothetical protein n=1 Tax=Streptomyces sp. URMC 129 TaxID=3423407 RepID=UPI003F1E3069
MGKKRRRDDEDDLREGRHDGDRFEEEGDEEDIQPIDKDYPVLRTVEVRHLRTPSSGGGRW